MWNCLVVEVFIKFLVFGVKFHVFTHYVNVICQEVVIVVCCGSITFTDVGIGNTLHDCTVRRGIKLEFRNEKKLLQTIDILNLLNV